MLSAVVRRFDRNICVPKFDVHRNRREFEKRSFLNDEMSRVGIFNAKKTQPFK